MRRECEERGNVVDVGAAKYGACVAERRIGDGRGAKQLGSSVAAADAREQET